jgi:hypothetical protein
VSPTTYSTRETRIRGHSSPPFRQVTISQASKQDLYFLPVPTKPRD